MALLYVDETEASLDWGEVGTGETIVEGEFVSEQDDGTLAQFDVTGTGLPDGIVVHDPGGDSIAEHDEDYFANYEDLWTYEAGDKIYYQPLASVDTLRPRSIDAQTSPASTEPDFTGKPVIGVVELGSGETRVVPSGYTYDSVTYSEAGGGDFVALGRLDQYPTELRISDSYDQRIPIKLNADTFVSG